MRVFLAGATGVLGSRLVPLLVAAGHQVAGMTRSPEKADRLRVAGAEPVVCDVFDAEQLTANVQRFGPDIVMHQLTDLPDAVADVTAYREANARIRRDGTTNLLRAARAASARMLAQSVAWPLEGTGGEAIAFLESSVLAAGGVVLRYGQLYGPGTYYASDLPPHPRIHIDDAAERTVTALDLPSSIVAVVED